MMKKIFAFTMNELMIAVTIIGLIAAFTVPSLKANFYRKNWDMKSGVFANNLHDVLKEMRVDKELKGHSTTESFVSALANYTKVIKICDNDELTDCFSDEIIWGEDTFETANLTTAKQMGKNYWDTNVSGVKFDNGVSALIAYNPECANDVKLIGGQSGNSSVQTDCIAVVFDVSGVKAPNKYGQDIRAYNIEALGVKQEGICSREYLFSVCAEDDADCFTAVSTEICTREECLALPMPWVVTHEGGVCFSGPGIKPGLI